MGRFRVFNNKDNTTTSSEYNKQKEGIAILKDLRSKNTSDQLEDFSINFCDGTIIYYKSYDIFINTVKIYNSVNPICENCDNSKNYLKFPSKIKICNCGVKSEPEPEPYDPNPEPEPCDPNPEPEPCDPNPEPCNPEPESKKQCCCRCYKKTKSCCKKIKKCGKLKLESDSSYNSLRDSLFKKI